MKQLMIVGIWCTHPDHSKQFKYSTGKLCCLSCQQRCLSWCILHFPNLFRIHLRERLASPPWLQDNYANKINFMTRPARWRSSSGSSLPEEVQEIGVRIMIIVSGKR